MKITTTFDVIIVGGGLAGLTSAIHLSTRKKRVLLIEKNEYPKHKVCGEYISNEVLPYLNSLGINPINEGAKQITKVHISTTKSNLIKGELPLGGFGMSRYFLDNLLVKKAHLNGVQILKDTVDSIHFKKDSFTITTKSSGVFQSKITIGAFGKRSSLDQKMKRKFIQKKSPYLAVKIHVKGVFPENLVALHNFKGGYCGVSKVEDNAINVCYITEYRSFKKHKNITDFQEQVVFKNKHLRKIFKETSPVFEKPLTISQVSFQTKNPVEDHIIMCGDTAGMIHPLCGNGMGMAISSAQLASIRILQFLNGEIKTREGLEKQYLRDWNKEFKIRLKAGHFIAWLFRNQTISQIAYSILKRIPSLLPKMIKFTHGKQLRPL
ncbi:NAD(P)/FAD-dependent oxidoreductase [bacterium]|nr:NAD(P)/FAD-dependent oxidoreductase [bacterium]MDA9327712.1 NAD(P)/FAD-dependent oxidoreductase [Flavobacteriaceae bacterium]MDA9353654.1 NAD(P)/FAD-dependent oxidoreductase [Flavobacteriaceae bacterium]MDA9772850.1 NAD(P)/FAD-dependent oxidoreductase [Flavobacteriaceae bacterium]MDB4226231.1 NAD(P)/FAD-dependent oxidoreductase [Flavobacteriaceae bacterium]